MKRSSASKRGPSLVRQATYPPLSTCHMPLSCEFRIDIVKNSFHDVNESGVKLQVGVSSTNDVETWIPHSEESASLGDLCNGV